MPGLQDAPNRQGLRATYTVAGRKTPAGGAPLLQAPSPHSHSPRGGFSWSCVSHLPPSTALPGTPGPEFPWLLCAPVAMATLPSWNIPKEKVLWHLPAQQVYCGPKWPLAQPSSATETASGSGKRGLFCPSRRAREPHCPPAGQLSVAPSESKTLT